MSGPAFTVRPLVSWPRRARTGGRYMMTIDLEPGNQAAPWPYDEEEIAVHCVVDAAPLFTTEAVDDTAVVLHRFGGTYGPVRYLLTAARRPMKGAIHLTLLNDAGMPVDVFTFEAVEILAEADDRDVLLHVPSRLAAEADDGDLLPHTATRLDDVRGAKAVLLRIGEPADEESADYSLSLYLDDGGDDWGSHPVATDGIPADDASGEAPIIGAERMTVERIPRLHLNLPEDSHILADVGRYLGGLLTRGEVGAALEWALEGETRVLLEVAPRPLRRIPWELAYVAGPLPLAADERRRFARVHNFDPERTPDRGSWPVLRILVLVGTDRADVSVRPQDAVSEIEDAFGALPGFVDVEVVDRPDRSRLRAACESLQPHILHFIGHGEVRSHGTGPIIADRTTDTTWIWDAVSINEDLVASRMSLVVLDSWETGWECTDPFLTNGVPAVVTMQGEVHADARARFVRDLYGAIAAGRPIDVAVAQARAGMADTRGRDVWLPALTIAGPPDGLLPQRFAVTHEQAEHLLRGTFAGIESFVDRMQERRLLRRTVLRHGGGTAVAVVGPPAVGKSALLKWCIGCGALGGGNVAYVDCNLGRTLDFLDVLVLIADALSASPLHSHANAATFDRFSASVDQVIGPADPADSGGAGGARQHQRAFRAGSEHGVATIFEAFREALAEAAAGESLTLALDGVEAVAPAHWHTYLVPELLMRAANGQLPVHLIVACDSGSQVMSTLEPYVVQIELRRFWHTEYARIIGRYLRARGFRPDEFAPTVEALSGGRQDDWDAREFGLWDQLATSAQWQRETP